MDPTVFYPHLSEIVAVLITEFDQVAHRRKGSLQELAAFVTERVAASKTTRLIFICTHNSRRSHMAQIWAQTAAALFGIPGVETFSGGTETTAFFPQAVAAIRHAGFRVDAEEDGSNPVIEVRYSEDAEPMWAFSKIYDQPPNPTSDYAAVMTCSHADAACPMVVGATERFSITYQDPKAFDGTDREAEAYDERCRQIGREMLFVFSQVEVM